MAKTNVPQKKTAPLTHEGGRAKIINAEKQLRRSVMACLLWENQFYEDGVSIADRIANLIPKVDPDIVSKIAIDARELMKLRHVPLWITRCMAELDSHKGLVAETLINTALADGNFSKVLPFRFIAAAKYNPHIEPAIEKAMLKCLKAKDKLMGSTILLIDSSGSMNRKLSGRSQLNRHEAACGLAILCREICERIKIFDFAGDIHTVPNRGGFGLRDAIRKPHNGTRLGGAITYVNQFNSDRIICITDEQSHDNVPDPINTGYMINVASYENGVGYGKWIHIDGWSEAILDYIKEFETKDN